MLWLLQKLGIINLPKEEKFEPYVTRCTYCNRPFTDDEARYRHRNVCAMETQKRLDADWFTPEEKL